MKKKEEIRRLTARVQELLVHNTMLTERARKAEADRDAFRSALLAAAHMGGMLAQELQREIANNS